MISLSDAQLKFVMAAASHVPVEKRATCRRAVEVARPQETALQPAVRHVSTPE